MYYRYKARKKNRRFLKLFIVFFIVSGLLFAGFRYRQYLFFWKYTYNSFVQKINNATLEKNLAKKEISLKGIAGELEKYKYENIASSGTYILIGKVHYLLAEIYQKENFTDYVINNRFGRIAKKVRDEYIIASKNFKKAAVLSDGEGISEEYQMLLAESDFYTEYKSIDGIYAVLSSRIIKEELKNSEKIRFYSMIMIFAGHEDEGLQFLSEKGMVNEDVNGRLFLAVAQKIAKKYTNSILSFKEVIQNTSDNSILKLVHMNLGEIYYTRGLYRESLSHFSLALKIDERDNILKIWIGKNYSAMGHKNRARAIWAEVLASDRNSIEAEELLGVM